MYISELNLHGFKSFAKKEKIKFGEGVTVIVGTFAFEIPGVISTGAEDCPLPRLLTACTLNCASSPFAIHGAAPAGHPL